MPSLAVVLDSNVYRAMGPERFEALRCAERRSSVIGVASYHVVTELLAHIASPSSRTYAPARSALIRLWQHCARYDGSVHSLEFIADSEAQVAHILFNRTLPNRTRDLQMCGRTVGEVVHQTDPETWSEFARLAVQMNARHVTRIEEEFVEGLWDVVREINPAAATWGDVCNDSELRSALLAEIERSESLRHIATALVQKAGRQAGITLCELEADQLTAKLLRVFPMPVRLYSRLVEHVIRDGPDMTKKHRANSIWDFQITFSVATGARLSSYGRVPLWLVTDDDEVRQAAIAAGTGWLVRSLTEYGQLLAHPRELRAEIAAEPVR